QRKTEFKFNQKNYITIEMKDDTNNNMNDINIEYIDNIKVIYNTIQMLFENGSLQSTKFVNILKKFQNIYFELDYPTIYY
uniref:hypothetical protein n=1 Tax=Salmonella sp. ZJHZ21_0024 TaxID=3159610 RepID=UPI003980DE7B